MVEITFLPRGRVFTRVKVFPITNDAAHRLVAREGNKRMQMIRHQEEQCDVPALSGFIRTRRIEQSLCERWVSQLPLLFVAIKRDADVKQCTRFNPVRNGMMEL